MKTRNSAFVTILIVICTGLVAAPRTCQGDEPSKTVRSIWLEVETLHGKGESSQAIAVLDDAIHEHGPIGRLLLLRGASKMVSGLYEDAIDDFSGAISLECDVAKAYASRGICRQAIGELDLAFADFNRAIETDRNCADAYIARARYYCLGDQMQAAVDDFSTAIQMSPSANAYIARAYCYLEMGDWDALAADATAAARLDPDDRLPIQMRMLANAKLGRANAVLEDWRLTNQLDEAKSGRRGPNQGKANAR